MVKRQTPYHRPKVQSKPVNQEALEELYLHCRSLTHVEVHWYVDVTNGNPDDTWLKTAIRKYERAANASIHTVLDLVAMTTIPPEAPLLINGSFVTYPKRGEKSMCFIYKLHIDDDYMPKLLHHLQKSNNSLTFQWNNAEDDATPSHIQEFKAKVTLPNKGGRDFILKGVPTHIGKKQILEWLKAQDNHVIDIRRKGRMDPFPQEGRRRNRRHDHGATSHVVEWVVKMKRSMRPIKMDLGHDEMQLGQPRISMFPMGRYYDTSIVPAQIWYPCAWTGQ